MTPAVKKPFRFSLAMLGLFILAVCVGLAAWVAKLEPLVAQWRAAERFNDRVDVGMQTFAPEPLTWFLRDGRKSYIKQLEFSGKVSDKDIEALRRMPKLESLILKSGSRLSDKQCEVISNLDSLRNISIGSNSCTDKGVRHLLKLPNLVNLDLSGSKATWRLILEFEKNDVKVANTTFRAYEVTDDELDQLAQLEKTSGYRHTPYEIYSADIVDELFAEKALRLFPELKFLNVRTTDLPVESFEALGDHPIKQVWIDIVWDNKISPDRPSELLKNAWSTLAPAATKIWVQSASHNQAMFGKDQLSVHFRSSSMAVRLQFQYSKAFEEKGGVRIGGDDFESLAKQDGVKEVVLSGCDENTAVLLSAVPRLEHLTIRTQNPVPKSLGSWLSELDFLTILILTDESKESLPKNLFSNWQTRSSLKAAYVTAYDFDPADWVELADFSNLGKVMARKEIIRAESRRTDVLPSIKATADAKQNNKTSAKSF